MRSAKKLDPSLKEFQRVISRQGEEFLGIEGKNLLVQACSLVGKAMGFELDPASESETTIEEICKKSQMVYREVDLPQKWWLKDHGHLVGSYKKTPVALIYKNYRYYIFSPATKERIPLDVKVNEELTPSGIMLYSPTAPKEGIAKTIVQTGLKKKFADYMFLVIAGLLSAFLGFFFPFSNKILFDKIIPNFNYSLFTQIILGLIVGVISGAIFSFIRSFFALRLNGHISHELQMKLWDRVLKLPAPFFRQFQTGDLMQRTMIFDKLRRALSQSTLFVIFDSIFALAYLAMMLIYSWQLTLATVAILGLIFITAAVIIVLKIRWDTVLLASNAKINSFLVQMINGIEKLRTAAAEKRVFSLWVRDYAENQSINLKSKFLQNILSALTSFSTIFLLLLIFGIAIWMRSTAITSLSLGDYLAFSAAFAIFSSAFFSLLETALSLLSLVPFWKRVQPIFASPLEVSKEKRHPGKFTGKIDVKDLYFRYYKQAPFVLKDLTLQVKANSFAGIVGPTGCGKSTLARLLVGFETPERGSICYDEKDLKDLDLSEVRKQVNVILQQNAIFAGKLYDNLVCGGEYKQEELEEAMHLSTFEEDFARFPAKLETMLPSGGGLLSGGERQRALLTRALLKKPRILILDEGINSLDSPSQQKIVENLKSLNMTKVLFTHQLNILEKVDCIHVLREGRFIASGTFDELLASEPFFQELVENQSI